MIWNWFWFFLEAGDLSEKVMEPDEEINTLMRKHRTSIRTFSKKGKVQLIFNFLYNQDLKALIPKIVNRILQLQRNRFKSNYVLRNIENLELRYYYTSSNNNVMMSTARLISDRQKLIEFLNALAKEYFLIKLIVPTANGK